MRMRSQGVEPTLHTVAVRPVRGIRESPHTDRGSFRRAGFPTRTQVRSVRYLAAGGSADAGLPRICSAFPRCPAGPGALASVAPDLMEGPWLNT